MVFLKDFWGLFMPNLKEKLTNFATIGNLAEIVSCFFKTDFYYEYFQKIDRADSRDTQY